MSKNFVMLWQKTLDSSIWRRENKETRLVWVTMLMMKDFEGNVYASKVGLADRARVTDDECDEALKVLLAPDPGDTSKVENGIRIREIPGGWNIINHDLYRFSTEAKRVFWAQSKADQRAKKKLEDMTEPEKLAYAKGRQAVRKKKSLDKLNAEIAGRTDSVKELIDEANGLPPGLQ
jgi:hypothetical protein